MKLRLIGGDVTCFSHRGRCRQLTVSFVCQATEMALTEGTVNSAASPPAASGETCVSMHFVAAWFYTAGVSNSNTQWDKSLECWATSEL